MSSTAEMENVLHRYADEYAAEGAGIERQLRIQYQYRESDSNQTPFTMHGYIRYQAEPTPEWFLVSIHTHKTGMRLTLSRINRLSATVDNGRTWKPLWERGEYHPTTIGDNHEHKSPIRNR